MGTQITLMRAGDMIQTDSPWHMYHRPKTPFAAGFIGETNLVDGRYLGAESGLHRVETPFGTLRAKEATSSFQAGQDVTLSFRPEAVQMDFMGQRTAAAAGANELRVTLEHLTYLGESEQLRLKTASGHSLKANVFNPPAHETKDGTPFGCRVDAEHVLVLPREADLTSGT
jgi:ABC-type Fe3+/spermidine/putrescine transport system ATPase subunit